MKHYWLLLILFLAYTQASFSQDVKNKDSIVIKPSIFLGTGFYQNDKNIRGARLSDMLKPNPTAWSYVEKARTDNAFSLVLATGGGFGIGYALGTMLGGKSMNWAVMGAGLGATVISIPFSRAAKSNASKAAHRYNASLF